MKKILFSILCINLFQASLRYESFANNSQNPLATDDLNLKKIESFSLDLSNSRETLILSNDQKKLTDNYLNLRKMHESVTNAIQTRTPLKKQELKNVRAYLKKQIQKHKNVKKFLNKITLHQPLPRDICRQELSKNLYCSHKKIIKSF